MPTKILLDTDIGSDIDDAVCLAYLLANQECELLGITTVSGEAEPARSDGFRVVRSSREEGADLPRARRTSVTWPGLAT